MAAQFGADYSGRQPNCNAASTLKTPRFRPFFPQGRLREEPCPAKSSATYGNTDGQIKVQILAGLRAQTEGQRTAGAATRHAGADCGRTGAPGAAAHGAGRPDCRRCVYLAPGWSARAGCPREPRRDVAP